MQKGHVNPYEAVLMHKELNSLNSMAIHFGTFRLSDENYIDPVNDLYGAMLKLNPKNPFRALDEGESWEI